MNKRKLYLQREANDCAVFRGHDLGEWTHHSWKPRMWYAHCTHCDKQAVVNTAPMPNEIDIGGEAIALHCDD